MSKDEFAERSLKEVAARAMHAMEIVDWREFYNLVATVASCRKLWTTSYVKRRFLEMEVPEETAEKLCELYGHCRCALYFMGNGIHKNDTLGWSKFRS
jgi:hypothetical protein